jgi:hypothetical protein
MSQNQLTITDHPNRQVIDPAFQESTIVERFTEASRAIVPSVEISLAKRIIKAGSNQVLCLAAHTSVPLNDDELASVSDLAVRLSDGTNVRLSLSFFNDQSVGCIPVNQPQFIPLNRSIYDPNRYELRDEPKLGLVLGATALIALAGLYSVLNGPFSPFSPLHWQSTFQSIMSNTGKAPIKTIAAGPGVATLKARPAKLDSGSSQNATRTDSTPSPRTAAGGETKSQSLSAKPKLPKLHQSKSERAFIPPPPNTPAIGQFKNMFVPPPPPMTYALPPGAALLPFDPLQGLAPISAKTKPPVDAKAAHTTKSAVNDEGPVDPKSAGNVKTTIKAEPSLNARSASETMTTSGMPGAELNERQSEHIPAGNNNSNAATAPLPGDDGYPALERIVIPNQ